MKTATVLMCLALAACVDPPTATSRQEQRCLTCGGDGDPLPVVQPAVVGHVEADHPGDTVDRLVCMLGSNPNTGEPIVGCAVTMSSVFGAYYLSCVASYETDADGIVHVLGVDCIYGSA